MQTIKILDEHIANQIAAGEVIERPVSVVKELVENAIDANASRISIDIIQGGLEQIKVTDNGLGMSPADASLAFERHATSKITNEKSLFKIITLGFRGEALPSISAISKLELRTKRITDSLGSYLRIEGAKRKDVEPIGCPNGTQIIVRDLFFNTPARLKYLKTVITEANHVNEYVSKMSMAYPSITFSYSHNKKQLFTTQGNGKLRDVLLHIYGHQTRTYWLPIQVESLDFDIHGFVAKPEFTRANRQQISFFVNGRYIRNPKLSEAITRAYHTLLPINKYPVTCIHISMDHSLVDVNVHPSKLEVRFSKENELCQLLNEHVQASLLKNNLIPEVSAYNKKNNDYTICESTNDKQKSMNGSKKGFFYSDAFKNDSTRNELIKRSNSNDVFAIHESIGPNLNNSISSFTSSVEQHQEINQTEYNLHIAKQMEQEYLFKDDQQLDCRVIGQIHGTYIVAEDQRGMLLIDQHAAHERINYEKAIDAIRYQQINKQDMIAPIQLQYSTSEIQIIKEKKELLDKFAVEFDEFGEKTIIVRAYPDWIPHDKIYEFTTYIFDKIISNKDQVNIIDLLEESSILFACKSSVKGNQRLTLEEMTNLVIDLRKTTSPFTCPHGRPIVIHYNTYEIEKLFKRKS